MKTKLFIFVLLISFSANLFSQKAIPVANRSHGFHSQGTYKNSQGFVLSKCIPDTCRVYINSKGKIFVIRQSMKTGNMYRQYLKSDSTNSK